MILDCAGGDCMGDGRAICVCRLPYVTTMLLFVTHEAYYDVDEH